jgi:NADH-quinone oxidoreductase subunit H
MGSIVLYDIFLIILKVVCLLVAIAYYTIAERKIMAAIQRRRGPNVVGFWGLLQPLADGLKLIAKEMIIPSHSSSRIFIIAPLCILTLSLISWSVLPFGCFDLSQTLSSNEVNKMSIFAALAPVDTVANVRYGILVILALSSLTVYGLIIAGWASNSKYAFLGALRSAAQMISYEVSISLIVLPIIFVSGSLNFVEIVSAQCNTIFFVFPLLPLSIIFFISMVAETNRTPFDLPEAEAELVAGYNVEYSSIIFAMFFLAEYGNMIMMSVLKSELFLGGWGNENFILPALVVALKALIFCFAFVLVRATFPRYRYDQLMDIGWKIFLPLTSGLLLFVIGIILYFDAAPLVAQLYIAFYEQVCTTAQPDYVFIAFTTIAIAAVIENYIDRTPAESNKHDSNPVTEQLSLFCVQNIWYYIPVWLHLPGENDTSERTYAKVIANRALHQLPVPHVDNGWMLPSNSKISIYFESTTQPGVVDRLNLYFESSTFEYTIITNIDFSQLPQPQPVAVLIIPPGQFLATTAFQVTNRG